MYSFFIENSLILMHDIYQFLDQGYEVPVLLLDISKAFDKF